MGGHQVKAVLEHRTEEVCEHLLPGGRVKNGQYKIGSISVEKGDSLVIGLRGEDLIGSRISFSIGRNMSLFTCLVFMLSNTLFWVKYLTLSYAPSIFSKPATPLE
jgi:hypothetical protein